MKPVKLKFSGLQSYREVQDISFDDLGMMGVFGVFGPTGGGKSTILDAITLALFGKVERAKGGTRGIINQFEEKLLVSFEFKLGDDTYVAERLYERDRHDRDSVKIKNARLIKTSGATEVLADRANKLDARIEEILGMSFEDFSRAVVLPQGKFDQFLKLTGGERAKMLEHIFLLERYGENLFRKAAEMEKRVAYRLETNQELLGQLGDSSEEAYTLTKGLLVQQQALGVIKEKTRKDAAQKLRDMEQLADLFEQINTHKKEQKTLAGKMELMNDRKIRLERSVKAEPLRNLLIQKESLEKRQADENLILQNKLALSKEVQIKAEAARIRLNQAKQKEAELKRLREKELPRVSLAKEYETQLSDLSQQIKGLRTIITEKEVALLNLKNAGITKSTEKDNLAKQAAELKTKQHAVNKVLEFRPEVDRALAALINLENLETQETEASRVIVQRKKLLSQEQGKLLDLIKVNLCADRPLSVKDPVADWVKAVSTVVLEAEKFKKEAEEKLEAVTVQNMAGALAEKLAQGQPCPVCGSVSHPEPASQPHFKETEISQAKNSLMTASKRLESLLKWEQQIVLLSNKIQNLEEEIEQIHLPGWQAKNEAKKIAGLEFERTGDLYTKKTGHSGRESIRIFKKAQEDADLCAGTLSEEIQRYEAGEKALILEVEALRSNYGEINGEVKAFAANISALENSASELKKKLTETTKGLKTQVFEQKVIGQISLLQSEITAATAGWESVQIEEQEINSTVAGLSAGLQSTETHLQALNKDITAQMLRAGFTTGTELIAAFIGDTQMAELRNTLDEYNQAVNHNALVIKELEEKVRGRELPSVSLEEARESLRRAEAEHREVLKAEGALSIQLTDLKNRQVQWKKLREDNLFLTNRKDLVAKLVGLLKGRKFVQFLAEEHLADMTLEASVRLSALTGQRYSLELDGDSNFVMRDDYAGGLRRPVYSLSGGETFLASLSMALALSSKIQLKGRYPLGFFFLDEGFGTLDPEKLEVVMSTLERLHDCHRMVGVITHVRELRNRMPRYLEVVPANQDGSGSSITLKIN